MVVQQARDDRLAAAGAAADLVGGLEHRHLTPRPRRGSTAAASPLGPLPTTTAVLMPTAGYRRCRLTLPAERPGHLGRDRAVGQPRLLGDRVGDLPGAAFDHAEGGVDELVVLHPAAERLRLDPGDDALARLELGLALHRRDQVLVVQVTVAEVEADERVADELGLPHGAGVDVGQVLSSTENRPRPWLCMRAPRDGLLQRDLGPLRLVPERDELVDLVAARCG